MHVHPLRRALLQVLGVVLRHLGEDHHVVERPPRVRARHLICVEGLGSKFECSVFMVYGSGFVVLWFQVSGL